jgi:hypothetical protein
VLNIPRKIREPKMRTETSGGNQRRTIFKPPLETSEFFPAFDRLAGRDDLPVFRLAPNYRCLDQRRPRAVGSLERNRHSSAAAGNLVNAFGDVANIRAAPRGQRNQFSAGLFVPNHSRR